MKKTLIFLLLCSFVGFADEALVTDRPDAAEASVVVGKSRFQIETSVSTTFDRRAGLKSESVSFPTLLRYGFTDWLEVRLESETFTFFTPSVAGVNAGFADLTVGGKIHFTDGGGYLPSTGILLNLNTPSGDDELSADAFEPSLKGLFDWDTPFFSIGSNFGLESPARLVSGEKFMQFVYAVAVGRDLSFLDGFGMFLELAGSVAFKTDQADSHQFDFGFTYLISDDLQWDISTNIGLVEDTEDLVVATGLSFRI